MVKIKKVVLTGANGFIGRALLPHLVEKKWAVNAVVRKNDSRLSDIGIRVFEIGNLTPCLGWDSVLEGVDVVIHLAARVHIMKDKSHDPLNEFREINVNSSLNLARQAAYFGVKRFIYISSIKVNGESTSVGHPFSSDDLPNPQDPYSISKYEAEEGLRIIANETGMEYVIIRPPLVYGPGVRANFLSMVKWLARSIPLPLGSINNIRSFVALDNLIDLIAICVEHPSAANQIFLVSDGDDLSTTDLLHRIGSALGKPAILIPLPVSWLYFFAAIFGYRSAVERLCSCLQVDISKTRKLLNWSPLIGVDDALRKVVKGFKK